jgi:hypothetical protein
MAGINNKGTKMNAQLNGMDFGQLADFVCRELGSHSPDADGFRMWVERQDEETLRGMVQRLRHNYVLVEVGSPSRRIVDGFSTAMEAKLDLPRNRAKGGPDQWRADSFESLIERLRQEVDELEEALDWQKVGDRDSAIEEACDVANFAMMIWDKLRSGGSR